MYAVPFPLRLFWSAQLSGYGEVMDPPERDGGGTRRSTSKRLSPLRRATRWLICMLIFWAFMHTGDSKMSLWRKYVEQPWHFCTALYTQSNAGTVNWVLNVHLQVKYYARFHDQNYNHSLRRTTLLRLWKPLPGNTKNDDNSAETCNNRVSCETRSPPTVNSTVGSKEVKEK